MHPNPDVIIGVVLQLLHDDTASGRKPVLGTRNVGYVPAFLQPLGASS